MCACVGCVCHVGLFIHRGGILTPCQCSLFWIDVGSCVCMCGVWCVHISVCKRGVHTTVLGAPTSCQCSGCRWGREWRSQVSCRCRLACPPPRQRWSPSCCPCCWPPGGRWTAALLCVRARVCVCVEGRGYVVGCKALLRLLCGTWTAAICGVVWGAVEWGWVRGVHTPMPVIPAPLVAGWGLGCMHLHPPIANNDRSRHSMQRQNVVL